MSRTYVVPVVSDGRCAELTYFSEHRAGSRANLEDAAQTVRRLHGAYVARRTRLDGRPRLVSEGERPYLTPGIR